MTDLSAVEPAPQGALARLMRRKLALFGLVIIALVVAGAVFAPWIAPFDPNDQMFDGLTLEGAPMPPDAELARMLKLPTAFFLKEYQQAAALYPNNKVFAILGLLREYDLKSKGMNTGQADGGELLKELLLKIY